MTRPSPSSIYALALIVALSFTQSACSTLFGMEKVAGARASMPSARTMDQRMPEREEYFYSGCRFYGDDTLFVMLLISFETSFLTSPLVIVYGIVDGALTVVADTVLAPFTYLADESRRDDYQELPLYRVQAVQPIPVDPVDTPAKDENPEELDPAFDPVEEMKKAPPQPKKGQ